MDNYEQNDRFLSVAGGRNGLDLSGNHGRIGRSIGEGSAHATPMGMSRPHAGGGGRASELSLGELAKGLRSLVAIVRSRWLSGFLAAWAIVGGLGYWWYNARFESAAVTTVLAQSSVDEIMGASPGRDADRREQEDLLRNRLSVMNSRSFSSLLAKEFDDKERALIAGPYLRKGEVVSSEIIEKVLRRGIETELMRGEELFRISFKHYDPEVAIMVADRMAATYLAHSQKEYADANRLAAGKLQIQADKLKAEIGELENRQRDYRKQYNIISLQESQGLLADRLHRLEQSRILARIERLRLEVQLSDAEADLLRTDMPFENPLLGGYGDNAQQMRELDRLTAEQSVLSQRYGPNHAKMRDTRSAIESVRTNIVKNFDLALRDLRNQFDVAATIEKQLEQEFKEAFNEGIEIGRLADQLAVLGAEVAAKRDSLDGLLNRVTGANLESELPIELMHVIDSAYIASPVLSPRLLSAGGIVLAGCFVFLGLPLAGHAFDQRIKVGMDVERELGVELIGGVPKLSRVKSAERAHIVRDGVRPLYMEPFMSIAAQMELASAQGPAKLFVVTSAAQGEGKSTLVSNLAFGFGRMGRKTLIVDCDLRCPSQGRLHGLPEGRGLVAWHKAGGCFEDVFGMESVLGMRDLGNGVSVLGSGGRELQPSCILTSERLRELFMVLESRFDVILIDTPPAGLFPDALSLAALAREVVLVERERKVPVATIRAAVADLRKANANVIGMILNRYSSFNDCARLKYGYSYYGDYRKTMKPRKALAVH